MPKPYLPKGSKTYYLRLRVPERYRHLVDQAIVKRSLGTRDPIEAKIQNTLHHAALIREWEEQLASYRERAAMSRAKYQTLDGRHSFDSALDAAAFVCEVQRTALQAHWRDIRNAALADPQAFWSGALIPLAKGHQAETDLGTAILASLRDSARQQLATIKGSMFKYEYRALKGPIADLLGAQACEDHHFINRVGAGLEDLLTGVLRSDAILFDDEGEVSNGWVGRVGAPADVVAQASSLAAPKTPKLSAYLTRYLDLRVGDLSPERADVLKSSVRDLIDVCGDHPLSAYTKTVAAEFMAVLVKLPPNLKKRGDLRHLPLAEVASQADALGLPRQSPKNLAKRWAALGSIFGYAQRTLDGVINPFVGKALARKGAKRAANQWDPFNDEELRAVLDSDLPWPLYWITWIALCTGARPNELLQLHGHHVRTHGELNYLYFSPELRLKTGEDETCVRSVPIHQSLIERGFLDFAAAAGDGPLFPNMTVHRTGRMSDAVGKRFSRHLQKLGIKRECLSLRSLRHSFKQCWDRQHQQARDARERLMGHAVPGVAGRYGAGYAGEAADMVLLAAHAKLLAEVRFEPRDDDRLGSSTAPAQMSQLRRTAD
jgi:integrase